MRTYDDLYFISDLHIGGEPGRQAFNQSANLSALLRRIAGIEAQRRAVLVLGGDIVDFLAFEEPYFKSTDQALKILEKVLADPEFAQIFAALAQLVQTPNRELVVLLGNHDLELALPTVRERLTDVLCGQNDAARGRLHFLFDGEGYRCCVGTARVVCSHGNEVDTWNEVDYAKLARRGADEERGQSVKDWEANAGTRLVIDVMNPIRQKFPFVELLKPETELVPKVLAVLDPEALRLLNRFAPIAYRLLRSRLRRSDYLGAPEAEEEPSREEMLDALLRTGDRKPVPASHQSEQDVLARSVQRLHEGKTARDLPTQSGEMLGYGQYLWDRLSGTTQEEALRRALADWLSSDTTDETFRLGTKDQTYRALAKTVGPEISFLIAGHTHLARALPRDEGGFYFNAGTWMRIIRLEKNEDLSPENFPHVYAALRQGTLAALDAATPRIVHTRPTAVVIEAQADGQTTHGTLYECSEHNGTSQLTPLSVPFVSRGPRA